MRTWLQAQKRTAGTSQERLVLKREDYLAIGGLKDALSKHAEHTYAELHTEEKQRVAQIMFRCLAEEGPQKQVVRRIATVGEIAQVADTDLQTVIEVAKTFLQPDRSFLKTERTEEVRADSTLDVSHEALLRHWEPVQTWLEQEAEAKHTFLRLAETAHLWESGQADILRPPELDVALQWEVRQRPNMAWAKRYEGDLPLCLKFLRASQRASTRRKWVIRGSILAAFMVVSLLTLLFYSFWNDAKTQRKQALELTAKSQHEEGKAWLEQALFYQGHRDFFAASMMAARSIGFDGYGGKSQSEEFSKEFPVLLQSDHPEYQEVQELFRRTSSTFQPIWQSPITSHHRAGIDSVAFSPDGQTLASGSRDNTIKLWEVASGRERATLSGHGDEVSSVAFSPDGQTLASGSWDKTIKLWEVDYVVNFHPNLADYLSLGWCKLDGRKLLWTDSTNNLYRSLMFEYINVSPFSHIGILRRQLPQQELDEALFWQSLRATNLDSALVLYEHLTVPKVQEDARESLIIQLTRAAQSAFDNRLHALTQWRLKQARSLVKPVETNHRVLETLKQIAELEQFLPR
jgi:Novel STAND NTPase 1/WD domain, G-beta repeat